MKKKKKFNEKIGIEIWCSFRGEKIFLFVINYITLVRVAIETTYFKTAYTTLKKNGKLSVGFGIVRVVGQVFKTGIPGVISAPRWLGHLLIPQAKKLPDLCLAGSPENKESKGGNEGEQDNDDDGSDSTWAQTTVDWNKIETWMRKISFIVSIIDNIIIFELRINTSNKSLS